MVRLRGDLDELGGIRIYEQVFGQDRVEADFWAISCGFVRVRAGFGHF